MKIAHYSDIPAREVNLEGAEKVKMRWLISQADNPPCFVMRMFEIEPMGHTPLHTHNNEHEVFVVEGEGELVIDESTHKFEKGFVIYVQPNVLHQFKNTGNDVLKFLCLIPK